jgi:hypothetical protein
MINPIHYLLYHTYLIQHNKLLLTYPKNKNYFKKMKSKQKY